VNTHGVQGKVPNKTSNKTLSCSSWSIISFVETFIK
jgi:hypothetical protein